MALLTGKLTKKLVENPGPGRHGDGNGLYLVVDPSGARRWIVRATVKGQRNRKGAPLRPDFGLGAPSWSRCTMHARGRWNIAAWPGRA